MRPAVGLLLFYKEKSEENENMKNYKMLLYWNIVLNYADLNLNQSGQYGQIYAEKFTSASLICKVFYGKMKAQWGKYTLLLNLL